jgi:hypothetical protein
MLGRGFGIAGSGELARVVFRVKREGAAAIRIDRADARDQSNQPVALGSKPVSTGPAALTTTFLSAGYPNPFRQQTAFRLGLTTAGPVKLTVYDVMGRVSRRLVNGDRKAGEHTVVWDGRDDNGMTVRPGLYLVKLEAQGVVLSRRIGLVR